MRQIIIDGAVMSRVSGLVVCGLIIKKYGRERRMSDSAAVSLGSRYINVRLNFSSGGPIAMHKRNCGDIVIGQDETTAEDNSSVRNILDGHVFSCDAVCEPVYTSQVKEILSELLPPYIRNHAPEVEDCDVDEVGARIINGLLAYDKGVLIECMYPNEDMFSIRASIYDKIVPDTDTLLRNMIRKILSDKEVRDISQKYSRSSGVVLVDVGYSPTLDAEIRNCAKEHSGRGDQLTAIVYTAHQRTNWMYVVTFDHAFLKKFSDDITVEKIKRICDEHQSGYRSVTISSFDKPIVINNDILVISHPHDSGLGATLVNYFESLQTRD